MENIFDEIRLSNGCVDLKKIREKINNGEYKKKIFLKDIDHSKLQITVQSAYNELIAEELAKDFELENVHYDIYGLSYAPKGCFSEDFIEDKLSFTFKDLIWKRKDKYYDMFDKRCTLEEMRKLLELFPDIIDEDALEENEIKKFNIYKRKLTENEIDLIMDQINKIYIFDILIANKDNNYGNFGILIDENTAKSMPCFDNEMLLNKDSINQGAYAMLPDSYVADNINDFQQEPHKAIIHYFSKEENKKYLDLFKSKLWIISEENIENVIKKVEERTKSKIDERTKNQYREGFRNNNENISNFIEYLDNINKKY